MTNGILKAKECWLEEAEEITRLFTIALGGDEQALEDQAGVTFTKNGAGAVNGGRFPAVRNMGVRIIRGIDFNVAFKSPVKIFGRVV